MDNLGIIVHIHAKKKCDRSLELSLWDDSNEGSQLIILINLLYLLVVFKKGHIIGFCRGFNKNFPNL